VRLLHLIFRVFFDLPRRAAIAAVERLLGQAAKESMKVRDCGHKRVTMATGGFHIHCADCSRVWVAFKSDQGQPDYDAMADGAQGDRIVG
jgi:hypothetical protein